MKVQSALVQRYSGTRAEWFAPGTDTYELPLKSGFIIDSYEFAHGPTRTNSTKCEFDIGYPHDGGEYFQGQYGVTIPASNVMTVSWGVWRCHISPSLWSARQNENYSAYGLNVYVAGPRGVSPWK